MVCFGAVLFEGAFALKNEDAIVKRWTSRTRDITDSLAFYHHLSRLLVGYERPLVVCRVQGVTKVTRNFHVAIISHFYREASPESELDVLIRQDSGSDALLVKRNKIKHPLWS